MKKIDKTHHIHENGCQIKEFEGPSGEDFGFTVKLNIGDSKPNCIHLFGENYVFFSCMGMCEDSPCPLLNTPLNYSCPGRYNIGEYENGYFQCNNLKCVKYSQVCDLINDCGDMSDELNCTNHMVCNNTRNNIDTEQHLIAWSQKCDGIFDCFDLSDECNEECGREILEKQSKLTCWVFGILAIVFNLVAVYKGTVSLAELKNKTSSLLVLYNKVLVNLIGCGDFLIGVYLLVLSVYDSIIFGAEYCVHQAEWLSGTACSVLGVISTVGSQVSLFAMTVLSVIRVVGLSQKSMTLPRRISKKSIIYVSVVVVGIVVASVAVAVTPLIQYFEDNFVQGMYYHEGGEYKLFIGFLNKHTHVKILEEYYKNISVISNDITWAGIRGKVDGMFSHDYRSLNRSAVHFYGNDGVCLFKYLVRSDDARRGRRDYIQPDSEPVVWLMLAVNLVCFVVITVSYIALIVSRRISSKKMGKGQNPTNLKHAKKLQRKIGIIIASDFLCWVPFIIICGLHNIYVIDATKWYVTLTMIVLPLNSIINPLIYEDSITKFPRKTLKKVWVSLSGALDSSAWL